MLVLPLAGVGNEVEHTKPLMIASHENALTHMEHLKDRFKSISIPKTAERISTKRLRPNIWIKVNIMRHILHFLAEPFFRLTRKKRLGNPPKILCGRNCIILRILYGSMKLKKLWPNIQINYNLLVFCNLAKHISDLRLTSQKKSKRWLQKNFHETLMCSFKCFFSIMIAFKPLCNHFLSAVMLFAIFCNHHLVFALTLVPVLWLGQHLSSLQVSMVAFTFSISINTNKNLIVTDPIQALTLE